MTDPVTTAPVRGHMTLSHGGVEVFATLMHLVLAHARNPVQVGDADHHRKAADYIRNFDRRTKVDRVGADAASATYTVSYPGRTPLVARVRIGKPILQALEVQSGAGLFVPIDLTSFDVRA